MNVFNVSKIYNYYKKRNNEKDKEIKVADQSG